MTGVANAKAAGGYQQRGVDQQGPTSNTIYKLAFYCFLKLFTGLFAVFFADRSVSFAPTVLYRDQDNAMSYTLWTVFRLTLDFRGGGRRR